MKISGVSMNDIILKNDVKIENLIYEIRGKQVMLDSDLARLYGCANGTKTINQAVKRHIEKFPNDFYFQLTYEEFEVPIWDFKLERTWWAKKTSLCIYRTRRCHACYSS